MIKCKRCGATVEPVDQFVLITEDGKADYSHTICPACNSLVE